MNIMVDSGLKLLKRAVLQILYENGESFPTPTDILYRCGIPLVTDNEGSQTTLIRGILAHLRADGHAKYEKKSAGWQITDQGGSVIEEKTDRRR